MTSSNNAVMLSVVATASTLFRFLKDYQGGKGAKHRTLSALVNGANEDNPLGTPKGCDYVTAHRWVARSKVGQMTLAQWKANPAIETLRTATEAPSKDLAFVALEAVAKRGAKAPDRIRNEDKLSHIRAVLKQSEGGLLTPQQRERLEKHRAGYEAIFKPERALTFKTWNLHAMKAGGVDKGVIDSVRKLYKLIDEVTAPLKGGSRGRQRVVVSHDLETIRAIDKATDGMDF